MTEANMELCKNFIVILPAESILPPETRALRASLRWYESCARTASVLFRTIPGAGESRRLGVVLALKDAG